MASLMKKLKTVYPYQQNTSSGKKRVKAMRKSKRREARRKRKEEKVKYKKKTPHSQSDNPFYTS